jgi:hypothetical protein
VVVNEMMVQRFWRGENPVGKRLQVKGRWLQVIGIAKNSKYSSLLETPRPFFYTPLRPGPMGGQNIMIRTRLGPETMANALAREVKSIDSNLAPGELVAMQLVVDRRTCSQKAAFSLLGIFGSIALLLAGIGLYGVMSDAVSQSRRELGLRMALGARASDLLRIVMSHGLSLTLAGVVGGAGIALWLTRLMGDLLSMLPSAQSNDRNLITQLATCTYWATLIPLSVYPVTIGLTVVAGLSGFTRPGVSSLRVPAAHRLRNVDLIGRTSDTPIDPLGRGPHLEPVNDFWRQVQRVLLTNGYRRFAPAMR